MPPSLQMTPAQSRATQIYKLLMEEVKIRTLSINSALAGHLVLPALMIREFLYLQLRMICEVIALGCLVTHGDIKATRAGKLPKEYSADRIVGILSKLHADFYPVPVEETRKGRARHLEPIKSGFLSKSDLMRLDRKAGGFLHRGTMENLLSPEPITEGFPDVIDWTNKIQKLLSLHTMKLVDGSHFICIMSPVDSRNVSAAIVVPIDQQEP